MSPYLYVWSDGVVMTWQQGEFLHPIIFTADDIGTIVSD